MEFSFPRKRIEMNILEILSPWTAGSSHWGFEENAGHVWQDTTVGVGTANTYCALFKALSLLHSLNPPHNPLRWIIPFNSWGPWAGSQVSCLSHSTLLSPKMERRSICCYFPLCFWIRKMESTIFPAPNLLENLDSKSCRLSRRKKLVLLWGKFLSLMGHLLECELEKQMSLEVGQDL